VSKYLHLKTSPELQKRSGRQSKLDTTCRYNEMTFKLKN